MKALVIFSGGQDSTTCLYWAKKRFAEVEAISFDYGQRHRIELEVAKTIASEADVPWQVFKFDMIDPYNALTSPDVEMEKEKPDDRPPNTLVEGRNMLFLTYAAIYAKSKDRKSVV